MPAPRLAPTLLVVPLLLGVACGEEAAPAPTPLRPPPAPVAEVAPAAPPSRPDVADVPAETVSEQPQVLSEKWYARFQDGQRSGWLHVVWTPSTWEGRETIHDRTESHSKQTRLMGFVEDVFETTSVTELERTPDGRLLHLRTVTTEPGRETVVEQRWTGASYVWSARAAGGEETLEVACEEPLPIDAEAFLSPLIRAGEVQVGDTFTYRAPNFVGERLETVELRVVDREVLTLPTGTEDCLRVEESVRGVPATTELWLDRDGVVRQYVSGPVRLLHTTERRARDVPVGGVTYSITVSGEPYLPRATSFDEAVVEVVFRRGTTELPDLPDSPFSEVVEAGDRTLRVRLKAHDDGDATVELPVAEPDVARWLRPTLLECSEHPAVQAAAREAIGDATDGREVAQRLLRYVFVTLDKGSGPVAAPNAAEILRDGAGDCSEHAVLFVALCRAVGLPARRHSGYALVGHDWGSHAFCEIWLGTWIGADPTTNELGTRARYIAFGRDDDPDAYPGLVSQRMRACRTIRVLSFREGEEQVDVAAMERDPRRDAWSGLALGEPPDGWTARIRGRGRALLSGPGGTVEVNVSSGMGDLPADVLAESLFDAPDAVREVGGRQAAVLRLGHASSGFLLAAVPFRRRLLMLDVALAPDADEKQVLETALALLAPTFAED